MKPTEREMRQARFVVNEVGSVTSNGVDRIAQLIADVREETIEECAREVEDHVTNRVSETGAAVRFHLLAAAGRIRALKETK